MPIKKVVVSAAGNGTRMLELSKDKPKHLIEIENKPFLAYLLDNILAAGYREIILVVGYKQEAMKEFVEKYTLQHPCKIEMVSQFEMLGPKEMGDYGTACPLKCVRELVGNEPFISLVGDNMYSAADLRAMDVDDNYCYVAGLQNDHPEKFGVLLTDGPSFAKASEGDYFLREIIEKPKEFVGDLINTSLYKFTPEVFEKLPLIEKSPRGEYEITDALLELSKNEKVRFGSVAVEFIDMQKASLTYRLSR